MNTEEFINRAQALHGNKYDYSKVEYKNSKEAVIIICPEHGEFLQSPIKHLRGRGCIKCHYESLRREKSKEFFEKAKIIHNDKYDYSKVVYNKNNEKVTIICPEHGEFEQTPNSHLKGKGCPHCAGNMKLTVEEFILRANYIHNNKYDYSRVRYKNIRTPVIIKCPHHGYFKQEPSSHLKGCGCPACRDSKYEKEIRRKLDEAGLQYEEQVSPVWLGKKTIDFIVNGKIAVEVQGTQHLRPVEYMGGEDGFVAQVKADYEKAKLCDENGLPIVYFTKEEVPDALWNKESDWFDDEDKLIKYLKKKTA